MFRSLHMKLVLVLVLLIVSVMAVVGTFLINSVAGYNIEGFREEMLRVFTQEFILTLEKSAAGDEPVPVLREVLEAYSGSLGIDQYRSFYILDGTTGEYLAGSDDSLAQSLTLTSNILTAMNGEVGQDVERLSPYFDVAVPIRGPEGLYIVGVMDDKTELNDLSWQLFSILIRSMLFGLLVAILLSFLLSKTITTPVERLTAQASAIAAGDFSRKAEVYASDEIGILTQTFNEMAQVLETTLNEIEGERNKLNTLFLHMADGVVAFDRSGHILHQNPAAEKMLGKPLDASKTYAEVFPNLHIDDSDIVENGRYIEIDYSANKRILKIFFAPFGGDEDGGLIAVLHDITEQQKMESSRREFVANVSHELRTPLTNIRGYTETLIDAHGDIDDETEIKFLTVVHNEADRMTHIVKDLLTLSQLDYERMQMNASEVSLRALALGAVEAMSMEASRQQVTLQCDLPEDLPTVTGDRERIEQVIVNIISNAIKYNRPQGSVTLTGGTEDGKVFLRVSDTGIGVPEEDLPRLFERFYRVDKARSRERGGTGLGLAIAKEIIEYHGGTIRFESVYGEGSVVTITLPMTEGGGKKHA
ncbi:MAG TPA: HAMP domain-containing protein [Candidatus Ventrousia excrementavium]|uniref:histidine kinase n=1 Tax=Candidatus Ventrousia excrementavium TaxID=2840961 RepID=A0A9D1LJP9_9CLOT|nr:HAMP domain-containing protein [Candidatus Ventrousia excrementavium]